MISEKKHLWILLLSCFFLAHCTSIDVFEKNQPIPNHEWKREFVCKGSFEIADTTSPYNLFLVLRHTDAYKYENICLTIQLINGEDSISFQQHNFSLGNDAGGWKGSGMDDIWEVRERINDFAVRFRKKGVYSFIIKNNMRDNPLKEIISAGLRVEKES